MGGLGFYLLVLVGFAVCVPAQWWDFEASAFLFAVGAIAVWRYGWGGVHLVRAGLFRHWVFPAWRKRADAVAVEQLPSRVYLLLTSFRIDGDTSLRVYRAAIAEAKSLGRRVTVVASLVEMADMRLVKALFLQAEAGPLVDLVLLRLPGSGKRDALANGFRAISASRPPIDAVVCVIDGDTILTAGALRGVLPFFVLEPDMDALTTDEICEVEGDALFRDWYNLRFAQRQVLMCSLGLSRRVLTLTGRFSAFRASIACDCAFIERIENDHTRHWRLGEVTFLTGDDKSSWFEILKRGRAMLYIPDIAVITVEKPPSAHFLGSAAMLMARWFGNMIRTSNRAIALGPKPMGFFPWWCLLDQRISMWSSMIGPIAALWLSFAHSPVALLAYLYWVLLTRFVQSLSLLTLHHHGSWRWPFLLFFNQIFGSAMKVWIMFRQDRQKWTRQGTTQKRNVGGGLARSTSAMQTASLAAFVVFIGLMLGLIGLPIGDEWALLQ